MPSACAVASLDLLLAQVRNLTSAQVYFGSVPEWLKGTGCKPVGYAFPGSNPGAPTIFAHIAQQVEHFLGKEEVTGSSPVVGSSYP